MFLRFNKWFLLLSIALFLTEVLIAAFVHDTIIRPFVGDMLVVILIYASVRTLVQGARNTVIVGTLIFAFTVEIAQYFNLVSILGLAHNKLARIVIGSTFDVHDLLSYSIGALAIWGSHKFYDQQKTKKILK